MTESKLLKARIHERQARTGESYSIARMHVLRERDGHKTGEEHGASAPAATSLDQRQTWTKPLESPETRTVLNAMYNENWLDELREIHDRLPEPSDVDAIFEKKTIERGYSSQLLAELKTHSWYLADDWLDKEIGWVDDYSSEGMID